MERHHAVGPERVHLLGRGCQAGDHPSAPDSANAGGIGGRPAPALLLARLQAPRPHRQLARPAAVPGGVLGCSDHSGRQHEVSSGVRWHQEREHPRRAGRPTTRPPIKVTDGDVEVVRGALEDCLPGRTESAATGYRGARMLVQRWGCKSDIGWGRSDAPGASVR